MFAYSQNEACGMPPLHCSVHRPSDLADFLAILFHPLIPPIPLFQLHKLMNRNTPSCTPDRVAADLNPSI